MKQDNLVLAIETSLKKGSLSLIRGGIEIASWTGNEIVSRSEDLVLGIQSILQENNLKTSDLCLIAVSIGPGSFTGLRVGIAVAKGLALAINCPLIGVSILETMIYAADKINPLENENLICIIEAGRENINSQSFTINNEEIVPKSAINLLKLSDFQIESAGFLKTKIIAEKNMAEKLASLQLNENTETYLINDEMGRYIGLYGQEQFQKMESDNSALKDVSPIYVIDL